MSIGFGLLKSIVENDLSLSVITEYGIDETFFEGKERKAFEFLVDFYTEYQKYPSLKTIEIECDSQGVFDRLPLEPVEFWTQKLIERKKFNVTASIIKKAQEYLSNGNIEKAIDKIFNGVLDLRDVVNKESNILDITDAHQKALERLKEIQLSYEGIGIPSGFPSLDKFTGGFQRGDINLFVGKTGVGKSYIALKIALSAWEKGYNVLFVSPEMSEYQTANRLTAMRAGIDVQDLKRGTVSYYGIEKIEKIINFYPEDVREKNNFFKILPSGMFIDVNKLLQIAIEYKPDLFVIDGIYLLKNSKTKSRESWKEHESIFTLLKEEAMKSNFSVVATSQYNRAKPNKIEGVRDTQSAEQIASYFFSLEYESKEDEEMKPPIQYRILKVKKSRDGETFTLKIKYDFTKTSIEEEEVISSPDYLLDLDEDNKDEFFGDEDDNVFVEI